MGTKPIFSVSLLYIYERHYLWSYEICILFPMIFSIHRELLKSVEIIIFISLPRAPFVPRLGYIYMYNDPSCIPWQTLGRYHQGWWVSGSRPCPSAMFLGGVSWWRYVRQRRQSRLELQHNRETRRMACPWSALQTWWCQDYRGRGMGRIVKRDEVCVCVHE